MKKNLMNKNFFLSSFVINKTLLDYYFEKLFFYIEACFENERQKLLTKEGYEFWKYLNKTCYRIKSLYPLLEKIIKNIKREDLLKEVLEKRENFSEKAYNFCGCYDFHCPAYTQMEVNFIVSKHCHWISECSKFKETNLSIIQEELISAILDRLYPYQGKVEGLTEQESKSKRYADTIFRYKAVTKRKNKKKFNE